jgi:hypothetical protein
VITGSFSLRAANGQLTPCQGCWVWFGAGPDDPRAGYSSKQGTYSAELLRPDWYIFVQCPKSPSQPDPVPASPPSIVLKPGTNTVHLVVGPCP